MQKRWRSELTEYLWRKIAFTDNARALTPRVTCLVVDRDRVVRLRVDAGVIQKFQKRIALFRFLRLDHVEVEDMPIAGQFNGQVEVATVLQPGGVTGGPAASLAFDTTVCGGLLYYEFRRQC